MQGTIVEIAIKDIIVGDDNRSTEKEIRQFNTKSLADNIAEFGLITPIIVTPADNGKYKLVAGERRFTACKTLKWKTIKAQITENDSADAIRAIENAQRKGLHPMDEALEMQKLSKLGKTYREISLIFGMSEKWVQRRMVLCNLIPDLQTALKKGNITTSDAYDIAREEEGCQYEIYEKCGGQSRFDPQTVKNIIQDHHCNLEEAPFDTAECHECPYNSENKNLLFSDMKCGHCLKAECYREKCEYYTQNTLTKLREEGMNVTLVSQSHYLTEENNTYNDEEILPASKFKFVEQNEEGSKLALIVDGKDKGKIRYIMENEVKTPQKEAETAEGEEAEEESEEKAAEEEKKNESETVKNIITVTKKRIFENALKRLSEPKETDLDFLLKFLRGIVRPSYVSVNMLKADAERVVSEVCKANPLGMMILQQLLENMDDKFIPTKKKIARFFDFLGINALGEYEETVKSLALENNEEAQKFLAMARDINYKREEPGATPF